MPIDSSLSVEKIDVPLAAIPTGTDQIYLETQSHLVLEWFESSPPALYPVLTQIFGLLIWALVLIFLILITLLHRYAFLAAMGSLILLLSISGVNALNIGGINTNLGLIICLLGLVVPAGLIHIFFDHWQLFKRVLVILISGILTLFSLIYFSQSTSPTLLFSENIGSMAQIIATGFAIYIGHAFISALFLGLVKLNSNIGIKITWHFSIISLLYLGLIALIFLVNTGTISFLSLIPYQALFFLVGCLGYIETQQKIQLVKQPFDLPWTGKALYLCGFAVSMLIMFKADLTVNTPMADLLEHVFIYGQLGFGILFFMYLMINFSPVINSGKALDQIIYKPPFFPYFHMRLGGLLTLLILLVYADGIVGIQFNTSSTQSSADYYNAIGRPIEATVLYDNAFERYRKNDKALNASAHLSLQQNQPTAALNTLIRSFNENPNVSDILLLTGILRKSRRINDAIFYLEEGLKFFPNQSVLMNNLALFYHKIGRPDKSIEYLKQMEGYPGISIANLVAIKTIHREKIELEMNQFEGIETKINLLAYLTRIGENADFILSSDTITDGGNLLNRALIRNQWANAALPGSLEGQEVMLDSLLDNSSLALSAEEDLRESGLVWMYKTGQVDNLLKQLNGMAYKFSGNAAYYHSFAANVLTEEMDLKKAAVEWKQALDRGFINFKSAHLPLLYFGGKENDAIFISGTQGVGFPTWMKFNENTEVVDNDTVTFYKNLVNLPEMQGKQLLPALEEIASPGLRSFFAAQLILKKSHWMEDTELDYLHSQIDEGELSESMDNYIDALKTKNLFEDPAFSSGGWSISRLANNPYLTPMVLRKVDVQETDEDKYNMLQDACQFNRDPLLWINLVKYSRIIGLHQYASSSLRIMSEWIESEDLTDLQIEYL